MLLHKHQYKLSYFKEQAFYLVMILWVRNLDELNEIVVLLVFPLATPLLQSSGGSTGAEWSEMGSVLHGLGQ